MKTYDVMMEAKISKTFKIVADSAEEAVRVAKRDFSHIEMAVNLGVTYLEDSEKAEELGELSIEFSGYCDKCGEPILDRHKRVDGTSEEDPQHRPWTCGIPSQEQVGPDKNPYYFTWCYNCLQPPLRQLANMAEQEIVPE